MVRQLNRVLDASSKAQLALFLLVQYIVVVVTLTILDLLVVCIDVLADWLWSAEIEWMYPSTFRISPVGIDFLSIGR